MYVFVCVCIQADDFFLEIKMNNIDGITQSKSPSILLLRVCYATMFQLYFYFLFRLELQFRRRRRATVSSQFSKH